MINNLIRKKLNGSIKRNIVIGFSILLALLSIVSFWGIRGINSMTDDNIEFIFEVKNTGVGIKPEHQKILFESFTQADVSTTCEFGVDSPFKFNLSPQVQPQQRNKHLTIAEEITLRILYSFKGITGTIASARLYPLTIELEKAFLEKSSLFESIKEKTVKELSLLLKELGNREHLSA